MTRGISASIPLAKTSLSALDIRGWGIAYWCSQEEENRGSNSFYLNELAWGHGASKNGSEIQTQAAWVQALT